MIAWRYEISLLVLKNIFQHSKRNFVSPRGHVISSMCETDASKGVKLHLVIYWLVLVNII